MPCLRRHTTYLKTIATLAIFGAANQSTEKKFRHA